MTANVAPPGLTQIFTDNGEPAALYKLWTYDAGTSTPRETWSDSAESSSNTNPVELDANGRAQIYYRGSYKLVLTTPDDAVVWTQDNFNVPDPTASVSTVFANGSAATPSVRFAQATSSGLFSPAANVVAMSINGAEMTRWSAGNFGIGGTPTQKLDVFGSARIQGTLTITTGGITVTAGGLTITAGGLTVAAGGFAVTGNSTLTGNLAITGDISATGSATFGSLIVGGVTFARTQYLLSVADGSAGSRTVNLAAGTWQLTLLSHASYDWGGGNASFSATQNATCGSATASAAIPFSRTGGTGHGYLTHGSGVAVATLSVPTTADYTLAIVAMVGSGAVGRGSIAFIEKTA